MRWLLTVSVSVATCCAAGFDFRTQVGVVPARDGDLCLEIGNASLAAGMRVTLVLLDTRQSIVRAEVVGKNEKPCSAGNVGNSYRVRRLDGEAGIGADAIAIVGYEGRLEVRAGVAVADLDRDGRMEFFRSCASHEGIHFTVWSGRPLTGMRRFHAYHYVGYDLEPNCTGPEVADAPGR